MTPRFMKFTVGVAVVIALAGWSPSALRAQDADREVYLRTVSGHFQVAESEARILLEDQTSPSDLPVLLLFSRETGIAPAAVSAYRRSGATWMDVAGRFDMNISSIHVDVDPDAAGPRLARAVQVFRDTPSGQWSTLRLSDDEVVGLVHVRVLSRYFQMPPEVVMEAREQATSWVQVPARLTRP